MPKTNTLPLVQFIATGLIAATVSGVVSSAGVFLLGQTGELGARAGAYGVLPLPPMPHPEMRHMRSGDRQGGGDMHGAAHADPGMNTDSSMMNGKQMPTDNVFDNGMSVDQMEQKISKLQKQLDKLATIFGRRTTRATQQFGKRIARMQTRCNATTDEQQKQSCTSKLAQLTQYKDTALSQLADQNDAMKSRLEDEIANLQAAIDLQSVDSGFATSVSAQ